MKVAVEGHVLDYSHLADSVWPLCNMHMCLKPKGKRAPASRVFYAALSLRKNM